MFIVIYEAKGLTKRVRHTVLVRAETVAQAIHKVRESDAELLEIVAAYAPTDDIVLVLTQ